MMTELAGVDRSITVNGINLHYIDWGGQGPDLLFLTGLGDTAWVYSGFAPRFADRFRVLALTRRGHGRSDKPESGYDTGTLVEDVRGFMDSMEIDRASLVGHSLAGDELTRFVALYPDRVERLVYLDAAYDRAGLPEMLASLPVQLPQPTEEDRSSWDAYEAWFTNIIGSRYPAMAQEIREVARMGESGLIEPVMPPEVEAALMQGTAESHPDLSKISVPALSIHAYPKQLLPLPPDADEATRQKMQDWMKGTFLTYARTQTENFRQQVVGGTVVEMQDTHHYCFLDRSEEVYDLVRTFLLADSSA